MVTEELSITAGPMADRAPAVEVHVHPHVGQLAPVLFSSLQSLCGDRLKVLQELPSDAVLVEGRAPFAVRAPHGPSLVQCLSAVALDAAYPDVEAWEGQGRERLPLLLERESVVCTDARLLVSEAVLEENARAPKAAVAVALRALGWRPRPVEVVKALLAEGLKRARRDFVFLPPMPGDASPHLSAWLLPLDGGLVVPEIDQAAFDAIGLLHELALGRLVQTFLDVQAAELEAKGFVVERLPMMPPTHLVRDEQRGESWVGRCASPTTSVLLEVDGRRMAFLPRPSAEEFPESYRAVLHDAIEAWRAGFERHRYEVVFVDDGPVKERGGCLRQLVAAFPAP